MKKIPEVHSLQEGFSLGTPFVIRGLNLPCRLNTCEQRAAKNDMELFGYDKGGAEQWLMASKAFKQYKQDALSMNIVDAPFPVLLDEELPDILLKAVKKSHMKICLTLTRNGSYTALHVDPDHGGGWMYLQEGVKKWQVFDIHKSPIKADAQGEIIDPPKDLDADFIYESTIRGGDFLYFPVFAPHRVWTYEKSFGVSGYAKL